MKKLFKVILIISSVALVLFNVWALVVNNTTMPVEMKNETVCFLAPGLTWNSSVSDVKECFGEPSVKGKYNDVTGKVTDTYTSEYKNRPMTVQTTRGAFFITEILLKRRITGYHFIIECADDNDAKLVIKELCNVLINDNKQYIYEKENDSKFSAYIDYGLCTVYYDIEYYTDCGENDVCFYIDAYYQF